MRTVWLALSIIVIDQITKTLVRTNMRSGQSIPLVGDWLKLTFTENPGMAFGIQFGSPLLVTILAILATILIVLYLRVVKTDSVGYRIGLALILGGAIGNIIDRIFNAVIYDYGTYFYGQVIDFIHVDVWSGRLSDSIPLMGGAHVSLFPIWNVADMAIVVGVTMVIVFQQIAQSNEVPETPATEPVQS
jgi:signal peptidase II